MSDDKKNKPPPKLPFSDPFRRGLLDDVDEQFIKRIEEAFSDAPPELANAFARLTLGGMEAECLDWLELLRELQRVGITFDDLRSKPLAAAMGVITQRLRASVLPSASVTQFADKAAMIRALRACEPCTAAMS